MKKQWVIDYFCNHIGISNKLKPQNMSNNNRRKDKQKDMPIDLWKVDDSISFLFMKQFYSSLFSKHDLLTAYHDALNKIQEDYPDPYDWAGFILVFN